MLSLESFIQKVNFNHNTTSFKSLIAAPPGFHVIATARSRDAIKDLEAMGMSTLSLEVTSAESIAAAKIEVDALTGGYLDILVNNAYGPNSHQSSNQLT